MRIHLIAIGGAAMHNLAIALHCNNNTVTGSDDEIYNPSRDRLDKYGLLPKKMGWDPSVISADIDLIILGMHARQNNPELLHAQKLGVPIYSYPEFLFRHAKDKTRLVIAGSHGKTTTTSMIMHVLKNNKVDFDYLVGAQIEGFETMVRLSDAPLMVIEGDEYLSSPIDRRPKILHYKPQVAIITGVAWDHINVFPTFGEYVKQFELFIRSIDKQGKLFYYEQDEHLQKIIAAQVGPSMCIPYNSLSANVVNGKTVLNLPKGGKTTLSIFGNHNLQNLNAAYLACKEVGITDEQFFSTIPSFKGAAKRLQTLCIQSDSIAFLDFAHAPSKVQATIQAMKNQYPQRELVACVELHTFSSLNKKFHNHYAKTMDAADQAFVYYSEHTLKMKKLPELDPNELAAHFNHPNLKVLTDNQELVKFLKEQSWKNKNLLLMTSGTFGGTNLKALADELLS